MELTISGRAVELIRREILREHPEAAGVNAVLIDFLLYDLAKEREAAGESCPASYMKASWLLSDFQLPTLHGAALSCHCGEYEP